VEPTGLVFNIQRFSLHDGPGIRTTVFLKGCSLRCFWCHNPEGIGSAPEVLFHPERCIACGECVKACPTGAQLLDGERREFRRDSCTLTGACVEGCPTGALEWSAREMAVPEVMDEVLRDRAFYRSRESEEGGVTLSGGEPLLQRSFVRRLLEACREESVHTAVETAGHVPWANFEELLPLMDLVMMDLKLLDPEKHREATGADNRRILDNARRLAETAVPLVFRVPVVPGVNDSEEEIAALRDFVRELQRRRRKGPRPALELLSFHPLAVDKYRSLGVENHAAELQPLSAGRMEELRALLDPGRQPVSATRRDGQHKSALPGGNRWTSRRP
jgi:pyruvate formate lyase activating enzyme